MDRIQWIYADRSKTQQYKIRVFMGDVRQWGDTLMYIIQSHKHFEPQLTLIPPISVLC